MKRKFFLDNIRWATVLLVLFYHVLYLFNAQGVPGGFGPFAPVQYQDAPLVFVYPWFMVLLFLVSGAAARYSLEKRTARQFIADRTVRMLVPSTLGLLAFQWLGGWLNVSISGGWDSMPADMPFVAKYLIAALSGTGPLWFAQMIWLFSLLLVLVRRLDKGDRLWQLGSRCGLPVLAAFALVTWGAAQALNAPVITVYRFGIYFAAYLLGYFVFSHDSVQERLQRSAPVLAVIAAVLGVAYTVRWFGRNYASDECLKSLFTAVYLWAACLAVWGCAARWWDRQSRFDRLMTRLSNGLYMLHYPVLATLCWLMTRVWALPAPAVYLLAAVLTPVLTAALYEALRRIPVLRWLVLGIKKKECHT